MTEIENSKQQLNESAIAECGDMASSPTNPGNPVTMSVTLNASGKEHVDDLLQMMKAAGLEQAGPAAPQTLPMRQDMERLRDMVAEPEMEDIMLDDEELEEYENEPNDQYQDTNFMTKDLSGGINRRKGAYAAAQDGDNPMAVESDDEDDRDELTKKLFPKRSRADMEKGDKERNRTMNQKRFMKPGKTRSGEWGAYESEEEMRENIKARLLQSLEEKKAKPDFLDVDKDGDKKEPMKKALKDKKKKGPVKESNFELSDLARKATSLAQVIKRKINSGDQMDDRDYNQMAELGTVLSRVGTDFGPKSMKDVLNHMIEYTDDRNQEGHDYPEMNIDRFKELISMAKSTGESMVGEISSDMAKRYTKRAKMDRDFNDDELERLPNKVRYGSDDDAKAASDRMSTLQRKNSKRQTGLNRAKKRM